MQALLGFPPAPAPESSSPHSSAHAQSRTSAALQPYRLPWTCEFRLSLLRKPHIIQSMSLSSAFHLPARRENLQPILADRLQHQEAWLLAFLLGLLQQALVDKRGHCIQDWLHLIAKRAAHRLDG